MLHQIGAGVLGPVFRAFDPESDRLVAVKRFQLDVPPERMHELAADLDRLVAAELTHPAIVAPIAAGMSGTAAFLAMEYVSGDSLDLALRDYGAAPPGDALRVAAQLASALDFAAVVGILHGALHPRDILLASDDTRMTGLGVAAAVERIGVPPPIRRPYTAPERVGGGSWDRRADIFSLAALAYEMLYGKRATGAGETIAETVADLPGADVAVLRDVFARAMATDPAARFATALELVEALRAAFPTVVVAPLPRPTPSPGPAAPVRPPRLPLDEGEAAPPPEATPRVLSEAPPAPAAAAFEAAAPIEHDDVETFEAPPRPADFDLRAAEERRYHEIDTAPAVPPEDATPRPAAALPIAPAAGPVDRRAVESQSEFLTAAIEQSRSAVWPLALALVVGLAIGFAGGYGVGSRDRSPSASVAAAPPETAAALAGRESTDVAVSDKPKPPEGKPAVEPPPAPAEARKAAPAESDTARAASNGSLLVHSTPSGARVFVDGHEYGTTPVPVRDLSRGVHRVRIVREGYATVERRVLLTPSRPSLSISVPLARTGSGRAATSGEEERGARPSTPSTIGRFVGALTVESRPTGARVFIDGKLVGTTPLQIPDVPAGSHVLALEHDGYIRWSSAIRVVASERNRVTASLEK